LEDVLTQSLLKITRDIVSQMKQNQEQTCGNFSDLNDDMDDIKGRLSDIERKLDLILSVKQA